jgi:putative ABC transport system permease protein
MRFSLTYMALRNLNRKPFRTGVLIFSITIFVFTIAFALSFTKGVEAGMQKTTERLGADILVVPPGATSATEEVLLESKVKTFYMDRGILDRLKKFEGVDRITYQIYLTTVPAKCCGIFESQIIAFDQETDFVVKPWLEKAIDGELKPGEVILGATISRDLDLYYIEDVAFLLGKDFKIAGVLEETGTAMDTAIFMREEDAREQISKGVTPLQLGEDEISVVFIKLKPGYDAEEVAMAIQGEIFNVGVIPRGEIGKGMKETLEDISKVFSASILMSAVLAGFLTWAIFTAIANERRRESGILRAVGARESHVVRLFLLEASFVAALGSSLGVILGLLLKDILFERFALARLATHLEPQGMIGVALLSFTAGVAICIGGALLPAVRVGRLEPLEAIKGE